MNGKIERVERTTPAQVAAADDDVVIRRFYARALPHLGYEVVGLAENGCELVELCRQHKPDVIVTDFAMPGLNGVAAVREICSSRAIPAIFVSAHSSSRVGIEPATDFPALFLNKPISMSDLAAALESVCALGNQSSTNSEDNDRRLAVARR